MKQWWLWCAVWLTPLSRVYAYEQPPMCVESSSSVERVLQQKRWQRNISQYRSLRLRLQLVAIGQADVSTLRLPRTTPLERLFVRAGQWWLFMVPPHQPIPIRDLWIFPVVGSYAGVASGGRF